MNLSWAFASWLTAIHHRCSITQDLRHAPVFELRWQNLRSALWRSGACRRHTPDLNSLISIHHPPEFRWAQSADSRVKNNQLSLLSSATYLPASDQATVSTRFNRLDCFQSKFQRRCRRSKDCNYLTVTLLSAFADCSSKPATTRSVFRQAGT